MWRNAKHAIALATVALLASCGGTTDVTIGGTLQGLTTGTSVVLQNNGADPLTLSADGKFVFATSLASGDAYDVTVRTQPLGQSCGVANGSGTVASGGANVADVAVTCALSSSLGGTLAGLGSGRSVTLVNDGEALVLAENGRFAFPGVLTAGSTYRVTVSVQPAGQRCEVVNGTGIIVADVMATVAVTCN
jgi:hypothetical protein